MFMSYLNFELFVCVLKNILGFTHYIQNIFWSMQICNMYKSTYFQICSICGTKNRQGALISVTCQHKFDQKNKKSAPTE